MTRISPNQVHETLGRHMLADGYDLVLDLEKSRGRHLHDARTGRVFLDMFSFFATLPIGLGHPMLRDSEFLAKLTRAALVNPTNSDVYTVEMAEFVDTFARYAMPAHLPHVFFIAGGAAGVENALKAAMDWKVRQNRRRGVRGDKGTQIMHFREAFHGRSGYTVGMTNTADPRKYELFAHFDWPRVPNPKLHFPVTDAELARVAQAERESLDAIRAAFRERQDDIAAIIIEPIQAEGGDNHFRPEYLRALRDLAHENHSLLIFDEVQTGMGITGRMWAHQHWGIEPDLLSFGKKTQICGMMGGPKLDEEPENVFRVGSRINSTWGGNLVDMVRCQRYLEIMHEEKLVERAESTGKHLLAGLQKLTGERSDLMSNVRGLGLMCAVDFTDGTLRNQVREKAYELGMMILPCGEKSLRFRPPLDVTTGEVDQALDLLQRAIDMSVAKSA
jgi:L-lysine 6-transaminase